MSAAEQPGRQAGGSKGAPQAPTPFQLLVGGLGAQVQIALGLLPDPTNDQTALDLDSARQGIDMLSALEEKTKGNLTPAEGGLLAGLLTQLRMSYVEQAKAAKGGKPTS